MAAVDLTTFLFPANPQSPAIESFHAALQIARTLAACHRTSPLPSALFSTSRARRREYVATGAPFSESARLHLTRQEQCRAARGASLRGAGGCCGGGLRCALVCSCCACLRCVCARTERLLLDRGPNLPKEGRPCWTSLSFRRRTLSLWHRGCTLGIRAMGTACGAGATARATAGRRDSERGRAEAGRGQRQGWQRQGGRQSKRIIGEQQRSARAAAARQQGGEIADVGGSG